MCHTCRNKGSHFPCYFFLTFSVCLWWQIISSFARGMLGFYAYIYFRSMCTARSDRTPRLVWVQQLCRRPRLWDPNDRPPTLPICGTRGRSVRPRWWRRWARLQQMTPRIAPVWCIIWLTSWRGSQIAEFLADRTARSAIGIVLSSKYF